MSMVYSQQNSSVLSVQGRFDAGDFVGVALHGATDDWRTYAALGMIGKTETALAGLSRFQGPEVDFYRAATCWIGSHDEQAEALLATLPQLHARNLLALIRKPVIRVLAQLPPRGTPTWDLITGAERDTKFEIRNISFHPGDLPNEPYADIHRFYDARTPPDFFACLMVEWHQIPPNIGQLPCPLLGATTDYDVHLQAIYPWLQQFDELVVSCQVDWDNTHRHVQVPTSSFPKVVCIPESLPSINGPERGTDIFFSGTALHPFHPDKARLMYQVLETPDLNLRINNGFLNAREYLNLLSDSKVCYSYCRFSGATVTRALEALSMGCAVVVQRESVLRLFLGEEEGLLTYDLDAGDLPQALRRVVAEWPEFAARATRGAEIVRREFAASRVGSQYLRFLTFLAARPRDPGRRPAQNAAQDPRLDLNQKRSTLSMGWTTRDTKLREQTFIRNLNHLSTLLQHSTRASRFTYIDTARELVIEYAARKLVDNRPETATPEMLDSALNLYRAGMKLFSDSLVLRFNFIRTALHFGNQAQKREALQMAQDTLLAPAARWRVDILEDVFPYDFFSEQFNYRTYFDLILTHFRTGEEVGAALVDLILASLHDYVAASSADECAHRTEATRLDPEFALYRLRYAEALLRRREATDVSQAGAVLTQLAEGSIVSEEAYQMLSSLVEYSRFDCPRFAEIARVRERTQESCQNVSGSWRHSDTNSGVQVDETQQAAVILRSPSRSDRSDRPPRVSALVPIYKAERFMRGLLEDLEAQTIADQLEIVICDTGSPQNERGIIAEYMARHDNIVYIRTEHRENSHEAINRCIRAATGQYLTMACADDRHRADALEVMARALDERPDVGVVYGDTLMTRRANETFAQNTAHKVTSWPDYSLRQLLMYNFFGPQAMWRRNLHDTHGVFDPEYLVAGDYELWLRLAWKAGAYHIPEILGIFLEGGNSSNQEICIAESCRLLARYRTQIPLEDIYPGLRNQPNDPIARAAALIDYGNSILSSASPDNSLTQQLYEQAHKLLGDHPVILNNLGVIYSILGDKAKGMALLKPLADRGDEHAHRNLNAVRSHNPDFLTQLQVGGLLHPFLAAMPLLLPPQKTQRAIVSGTNGAALPQGQGAPKPVRRQEASRPTGVSFVVITAGKRPELLELVIRSIHAQQIPTYEIIIAGDYQDTPGIRYIPSAQAARDCRRGEMRNRGMKEACYDRIVFLDDDCILAPDWYRGFAAGPQDYDLLTMRMRLPDGSRYWDHVMTEGPGKQKIMLDHETDALVYATSGAMAIKSYVADSVPWDEMMEIHEDVEFSRRCQANGYTITYNPTCLVYHADATYTSIGRWTMRRSEERTHCWVQAALADLAPVEIYAEGEARLGRDQTAEAADCFRYGALRYPADPLFQFALAGIEQSSGGHLPGVAWFLAGDPDLYAALSAYGAESGILQRLDLDGAQSARQAVRINENVKWETWERKSRPLCRPGHLPIRLDPSDYIQEAGPLLLALEAAGLAPAVQPALSGKTAHRMPVALEARLQAAQQRRSAPGGIHINSLFPPHFSRSEDASIQVGRAMFDVDGLPQEWVDACNRVDAVWVPSEFNRRTFARAGVDADKLVVTPSPLHMALYDPALRPLPIDGARGFNFLAILDWRRGKGWETLLRAYVQEFTAADDVALVLRPHSTQGLKTPQITQAVIANVQQAMKGDTAQMPTILLHDAEAPRENMPNLYRAADCFVLPSHGEGCGRVFLEAMAMGLPVIGPNWGACRDFMTPSNSYLVDCRETAVSEMAARETPLYRGCRWAEPDLTHLRRLMRQVYTRREAAKAVGARARADIAARFGHEQVAEVLQRELARLADRSNTRVPVMIGGSAATEPALWSLSVTAEVMLG